MQGIDDTIEQVKKLIAQRDDIYRQLEVLLGAAPRTRKPQACGTCGEVGHSSRTCPQKTAE